MIYEGVEGSADLKKIYKRLNKNFFSNQLPTIKLQWSGKLKKSIGRAMVSYKGTKVKPSFMDKYSDEIEVSNIELNMASLKIQIGKGWDLSKDDVDAIMLHEMVHILLYTQKKIKSHHGTAEFDGWILKLREMSGLQVPMKESTFTISPKLAAKLGLVLVFQLQNGDYGVIQFSIPSFKKKWLAFLGMANRVVQSSNRVFQIDFYMVSHAFNSVHAPTRSLNKISWSYPDGPKNWTTAFEIMRQGKKFGEITKGTGAWLTPHIAGVTDSNGKTYRYDKNSKLSTD